MPGKTAVPDVATMQKLVGFLLTWILPVDTGVVVTDALDLLKYGVTTEWNEIINSAST
jgi:hypothetical protein